MPKKADPNAQPSNDTRTAKIRCLDRVKARGFTFSRGKVVTIALTHAEYLVKEGKAEILDVTAAPAP
jgi:hypothetical protein